MAVKVREIPATPEVKLDLGPVFASALALTFGLVFWLVGARYTLDGWVVGLNTLLGFLQLPVRIPLPTGWWILLCVPLGMAYSWVEFKARPGRPGRPTWRTWMVGMLLWMIVIATDVGSTYLGIQNPGLRPWPVSVWLVATPWAGGLWALILTFWPELLIIFAVRRK
jgi:hypothetical protein